MPSDVFIGGLIVVAIGVLSWLIFAPARPVREPENDDVDLATLEAAEDEVRELDTFTSPEDAEDDLPDWGPGVPKRSD